MKEMPADRTIDYNGTCTKCREFECMDNSDRCSLCAGPYRSQQYKDKKMRKSFVIKSYQSYYKGDGNSLIYGHDWTVDIKQATRFATATAAAHCMRSISRGLVNNEAAHWELWEITYTEVIKIEETCLI